MSFQEKNDYSLVMDLFPKLYSASEITQRSTEYLTVRKESEAQWQLRNRSEVNNLMV